MLDPESLSQEAKMKVASASLHNAASLLLDANRLLRSVYNSGDAPDPPRVDTCALNSLRYEVRKMADFLDLIVFTAEGSQE